MKKGRITYRFDRHGQALENVDYVDAAEQESIVQHSTRLQEKRDAQFDQEKKHASEDNIIPLQREDYDVTEEIIPPSHNRRDVDGAVLNHYTNDFGAWSSSYDAEVSRIEKIIKEASLPKSPYSAKGHHPTSEASSSGDYPGAGSDLYANSSPSGTSANADHPEFEVPLSHGQQPASRRPASHEQQADFRSNRTKKETKRLDKRYGVPIYEEETKRLDNRYGVPIHEEETKRLDYRYEVPIIDEDAHRPRYLRHTRPPWTKMILFFSGAVATGLLFGWFVLSLFSGGSVTETFEKLTGVTPVSQGNMQDDPQPSITDPSVPITDAEEPSDVSVTVEQEGVIRVNLPAKTFTIIQHGVFSSADGVKEAQQSLELKGFAGVSELKDKYYVFTGLATNRDEAIILKHRMDQAQLESMVKEYTLPAVSMVRWSGPSTKDVSDYFITGNEMVEMISRLSIFQLEKSEFSSFDPASIKAIREAHQEWTQLSSALVEHTDAQHHELLLRMNKALDLAVVSLQAFNKNESAALLWQAQAGITQFVLLQQGLLAELEVT